jgi:hypothetical protein
MPEASIMRHNMPARIIWSMSEHDFGAVSRCLARSTPSKPGSAASSVTRSAHMEQTVASSPFNALLIVGFMRPHPPRILPAC